MQKRHEWQKFPLTSQNVIAELPQIHHRECKRIFSIWSSSGCAILFLQFNASFFKKQAEIKTLSL
jgi:hypothetical protein